MHSAPNMASVNVHSAAGFVSGSNRPMTSEIAAAVESGSNDRNGHGVQDLTIDIANIGHDGERADASKMDSEELDSYRWYRRSGFRTHRARPFESPFDPKHFTGYHAQMQVNHLLYYTPSSRRFTPTLARMASLERSPGSTLGDVDAMANRAVAENRRRRCRCISPCYCMH